MIFGFKRSKKAEENETASEGIQNELESEAVKQENDTKQSGRGGIFSKALKKLRGSFLGSIKEIISKDRLSNSDLEDLEALLLGADVGPRMASKIIEEIKTTSRENTDDIIGILRDSLVALFEDDGAPLEFKRQGNLPKIIVVVGVNGVGKTTTIGKLARLLKERGVKVLLCAADTYRAAAREQLISWADRCGVDIICGEEGVKPATVVFDGVKRAIEDEDIDCVIIDTAGRLHNRANLMQELEGIRNVIRKQLGENNFDVVLVVDGTTGQNAIMQAVEFNKVMPITGIIITKLDGSSKGGFVFGMREKVRAPIWYVGIGEGIEDLVEFDPVIYVDSMLDLSKEWKIGKGKESANAIKRRQKRLG